MTNEERFKAAWDELGRVVFAHAMREQGNDGDDLQKLAWHFASVVNRTVEDLNDSVKLPDDDERRVLTVTACTMHP